MKRKWWHDKIAYQIYPKSFLDTNGDGIGDLQGIISKLDYLKGLGVDILWLCPIYESPFVDQGYDVSDYYRIAEEFGTMEDFDLLLEEAKKRDMYIVMDLVANHCSDQHAWFQEALADSGGPYADYFYFVRGEDGRAPSNARSYFGGSAWEPVPGTDLFYLHLFAKEQPDLNWENPILRREIYDMVNWWLDKGVAGFRIDAISNIKKDITFPSYPADGEDGLVSCGKLVDGMEGLHTFLDELKREAFERRDAFTVAELFQWSEDELEKYVGDDGHFSTIFDFSAQGLIEGEHGWYENRPLVFAEWRDTIFVSQKRLKDIGFLANIIENHDVPRGASRFLPEHARNEAGKKMLATTSLLLRGIPFLYQGQEIGMTNCERADISEYEDISTRDQYRTALAAGCSSEEALRCCRENSRDNARTPMQWSSEKNAGFSDGKPWLAMNPNYTEINVAEQEGRADSVLSYYKRLIALRKSPELCETFTYGAFVPAYEEQEGIFAYERSLTESGHRILVAANYGTGMAELELDGDNCEVLLSNMGREQAIAGQIKERHRLSLDSCEAVVMKIKNHCFDTVSSLT